MKIDDAFIFQNSPLILTVNQRLTQHIKKKFNEHQKELGKSSWRSLPCYSFNHWLTQCWQYYIKSPLQLLTDYEMHCLWQQIIIKSSIEMTEIENINLSNCTKDVIKAWQLLQEWQIPLNKLLGHSSIPITLFYQWANEFQAYCKKFNLIDTTSMKHFILNALQEKKITLPSHIVLAGFDQLTPISQACIKAMQMQANIHYYQPQIIPETREFIAVKDETKEIQLAAQWAKSILTENNEAKIACIFTNLTENRNKILRVFTETFQKEVNFSTAISDEYPFNISLGTPLDKAPLIHDAFLFLNLFLEDYINIDTLLLFLRSPFLGDSEKEYQQRAVLTKKTLETSEPIIHIKKFLKLAMLSAPKLYQKINKTKTIIQKFPLLALPEEWRTTILNTLSTFGWPGHRTLNSEEYQQQTKWLEILDILPRLNPILNRINYKQAVIELLRLTQQTIFQKQSTSKPIQILGLLENAGLEFDALWIAGMDDQQWPAHPIPNPFLPLSLQREQGMPHASSHREYTFSDALFKRLSQSAKNIVYSYTKEKGGQSQQVSDFIRDLPHSNREIIINTLETESFSNRQIEFYDDNYGTELDEEKKIVGGTAIFSSQARCPFQAYARYRLGAQRLEMPEYGLNSAERGEIVHEILSLIWEEIKNQEMLLSISQEKLDMLITLKVENVLSNYHKNKPLTLRPHFFELEKSRLIQLTQKILENEKKRPSFSVMMTEHQQEITLNIFSISTRIDRIDQLTNGQQIIIDYKTGKTFSIKKWLSPRLEEPQLPLYCLGNETKISGIFINQVNSLNCKYIGLMDTDLNMPGGKLLKKELKENRSWTDQINVWRENLMMLADEFSLGIAAVQPIDKQVCGQCDLQSFCRIGPATDHQN